MPLIKKLITGFFIVIIGLVLLIVLALVVTDNTYVFRGVQLTHMKGETTANIDDYVNFDTRTIKPSPYIPW